MRSAASERFKIIMVEDDEGHATLIQRNLQRAGIGNEIIHIGDGIKAANFFFGEDSYRNNDDKMLVLLDLNLPGMDGCELLKLLKGNKRTNLIPVIILTTTDNPKEINRCYELGCSVYVTKPVDYENFTDAIAKLGLMLAVVKIPAND